ncbi:MAG: hypothetical protein QW631_03650 [Candidatus Aenigmatarchaeota archaeon]
MKVNPSSPAPVYRSDASNPESVSKQASLEEASGYPKKEVENSPRIIKIRKKIAEFKASLHASVRDIGELIEILENNGYEVEDSDPFGFAVYRVVLIPRVEE